jgi:hypothetical protein
MENSGTGRESFLFRRVFFKRTDTHFARKRHARQQDLARFWQTLHDPGINELCTFVAAGWQQSGTDSAAVARLPINKPKTATLAAKRTQPTSRSAAEPSKVWNYDGFRR